VAGGGEEGVVGRGGGNTGSNGSRGEGRGYFWQEGE
jgi:hypothetical protein